MILPAPFYIKVSIIVLYTSILFVNDKFIMGAGHILPLMEL